MGDDRMPTSLKILLMKKIFFFLFFICVCTFFSCSKKGITGPPVSQSHTVYLATSTDGYTISDAVIEKGFLRVTITAPGCDGSTWSARMIDSQEFDDSNPPTRFLRLALKNTEDCDTQVTKTYYFDVSGLRVIAFRTIMLQVDGFSQPVKYSY